MVTLQAPESSQTFASAGSESEVKDEKKITFIRKKKQFPDAAVVTHRGTHHPRLAVACLFFFFRRGGGCGGGGRGDPRLRSHLDGPLLKMKLCDARLGAGGGELLLLKLSLDAGQAAGQRAGLGLIHHLQAGREKNKNK